MAPVIDLGGNHPFMKKYPDPYNIRINASGIRHVLRGEVPQPVRDRRRGRRPGTRPAGMGPVAVGRPQGELQVLQLRALHQRQGGEARRGAEYEADYLTDVIGRNAHAFLERARNGA